MDKLGKYKLFLALLTLCDGVVSAGVGFLWGKVSIGMTLALVTVVSQSTVGLYLAGRYKEETYRVIEREYPGSHQRLLREGETAAVPYPGPVEALLKTQRHYQSTVKYLIWVPLIVYGIVIALCH